MTAMINLFSFGDPEECIVPIAIPRVMQHAYDFKHGRKLNMVGMNDEQSILMVVQNEDDKDLIQPYIFHHGNGVDGQMSFDKLNTHVCIERVYGGRAHRVRTVHIQKVFSADNRILVECTPARACSPHPHPVYKRLRSNDIFIHAFDYATMSFTGDLVAQGEDIAGLHDTKHPINKIMSCYGAKFVVQDNVVIVMEEQRITIGIWDPDGAKPVIANMGKKDSLLSHCTVTVGVFTFAGILDYQDHIMINTTNQEQFKEDGIIRILAFGGSEMLLRDSLTLITIKSRELWNEYFFNSIFESMGGSIGYWYRATRPLDDRFITQEQLRWGFMCHDLAFKRFREVNVVEFCNNHYILVSPHSIYVFDATNKILRAAVRELSTHVVGIIFKQNYLYTLGWRAVGTAYHDMEYVISKRYVDLAITWEQARLVCIAGKHPTKGSKFCECVHFIGKDVVKEILSFL